jgi:hypothetical protein
LKRSNTVCHSSFILDIKQYYSLLLLCGLSGSAPKEALGYQASAVIFWTDIPK